MNPPKMPLKVINLKANPHLISAPMLAPPKIVKPAPIKRVPIIVKK